MQLSTDVSPGARPAPFSITTLFNRQWWWTTLLVVAAMGVMVRLGFWQLDRLAQRRARNAEIVHQLSLPPLPLTGETLPDDVTSLRDRRATVRGEFDFTQQIALKLQNWQNRPGVHLVTPLVIEGSDKAVLVDRGWIPEAEAAMEIWSSFAEPELAEIAGFLQLSQTLPAGRGRTNVAPSSLSPQLEWYRLDIEAIQAQMPYDLLAVYLLQSPGAEGNLELPIRLEPEFDLTEGPHLGYAIQWFFFALLLGVGYAHYVRKSGPDA